MRLFAFEVRLKSVPRRRRIPAPESQKKRDLTTLSQFLLGLRNRQRRFLLLGQLLRRNRGQPPRAYIVSKRRESLSQRSVNHGSGSTQGMILTHPLLRRQITENVHNGLPGLLFRMAFYLLRFYIGIGALPVRRQRNWFLWGPALGLALTAPLAFWANLPTCPKAEPWVNLATGILQGTILA
jgi:hypothetical protein